MLRLLGGVLLAGLIAAGGVLGWGFWLHRQAGTAADDHMKLLFTHWRYDDFEFLASDAVRADPKARSGMKELVPFLRRQLGELRSLGEVTGKLNFRWGEASEGRGIFAHYAADAQFEKARTRVQLQLVRERGFWRVLGFWIEPVPMPGGGQAGLGP